MPDSFIDSNVVLYSLSSDDAKKDVALDLLAHRGVISTQVLSEVANVMRRKLGFGIEAIRAVLMRLIAECNVHVVVPGTILGAVDVAEQTNYSWFDSLIIAAAMEAGCTTLYSEDLQHGQIIDGRLTILNPFLLQTRGAAPPRRGPAEA